MKSLKDKTRLARQLSLSNWLALVEAWWMLLFFYLALRGVSYERLVTSTHSISEKILDASGDLIFAGRIQQLVGYASRLHLVPMRCLVRSLALQKMLRRRNVFAQVRIGVHKSQGHLYAHAWVEVSGEAIGEAEEVVERFSVLEPINRFHS